MPKYFANFLCLFFVAFLFPKAGKAQPPDLNQYNIIWNSQSQNSSESMPCGGGDIGLNVWVENGEILFYLSRSGAFDENNLFPKLGRVRLNLQPNPLAAGAKFRQELKFKEGYVEITGGEGKQATRVKIWVDVFRPTINLEVNSNQLVQAVASYENWRTQDRELFAGEKFATSLKWSKLKTINYKDEVQ